MKIKDLRQLSEPELTKVLHDTQEEIGKLLLQKAIGQLDNVHLIRIKRKLVAKVLTLIKEKDAAVTTQS
jgi:ribosomal protein L29